MKILMPLLFSIFFVQCADAQQNTLQFFVETAKENSPFINRNKNESRLVQLDLEQIRSIYSRPEISLDASILFAPIVSHDNGGNHFEWVSPGNYDYNGYDQAVTDGGQYQALVTAKQPLFNGNKLNVFSKKTDVSQQINKNNIVLSEHEIENVVNHQFILTMLSERQAKSIFELVLAFEKEIAKMQILVENAIYKQSDLKLLQIEYQNYLLEYEGFSAEYDLNLNNLKLLCGITDTTRIEIQDVDFQLYQLPNENSKFLTSFILDSLNATLDEEIFKIKYKPQLSLFLNVGLNAVYQPAFDRFGFGTGLTLNWTLFDGNQLKFQRQKTMINLQTIGFEKQNAIRQNAIQKNGILNQINALNQQIAITERQLQEYSNLLEMYSLELSQASISVMDFKNLLKDMSAKKQQNLILSMEKQILINTCNYWNF